IQYNDKIRTKRRKQTIYKNIITLLKSYTNIYKDDNINTRSNYKRIKTIQEIQREITEWQRQKELEQKKRRDAQVTEPASVEPEPVIQKKMVKYQNLRKLTKCPLKKKVKNKLIS